MSYRPQIKGRPGLDGAIFGVPCCPRLDRLWLVVVASLILCGCARKGEVRGGSAAGFDLMERLMPVNATDQDKNVNRHLSVIRSGIRKDAMALVAPVTVQASLRGASGRMMLMGFVTPVFNIGDGIQMDLYLERDGQRRLIGMRYFDAGRRAEDRAWVPIAFPVDLGDHDQLDITISAGPQGDLVADWLALSSMRLIQRDATP